MMLNYATDLLHAHQIRRENVFLYSELESCRNEVADLRNEMKQIQMARNSSDAAARKGHDLATAQKTKLQAQDQVISHLQETTDVLQNDLMALTKAYDQLRYNEEHQRVELERKIEGLEKDAQEASEAHSRSNVTFMETVCTLRTSIENKADVALVNLLVDRLKHLSPDSRSSSPSTSIVYESIEQQEPISPKTYRKHGRPAHQASTHNAEPPDIQVEDSQKLEMSKTMRREAVNNFSLDQHDSQRGTTETEDIDLDANAPTISYAGHYRPALNDLNKGDSLSMLPELNVQASRLAQIKTLKQGRYEGWDAYYAKGKDLIDSLPQEFETTIMQQFVNGMSEGVRRAQCHQWLENAGWKWENMATFGILCSQIDDGSGRHKGSERTNGSQPIIFNDIDQGESRPSTVKLDNGAPSKPTQPARHSKWPVVTLRRSQRLIERARRQANNNISGRPEPAHSRRRLGSKETIPCNGKQTVAPERTSGSEEIDISPPAEGPPSSGQTPHPVLLGKQPDRENSNDQGCLYTARLPLVVDSEYVSARHTGAKKRRLSSSTSGDTYAANFE